LFKLTTLQIGWWVFNFVSCLIIYPSSSLWAYIKLFFLLAENPWLIAVDVGTSLYDFSFAAHNYAKNILTGQFYHSLRCLAFVRLSTFSHRTTTLQCLSSRVLRVSDAFLFLSDREFKGTRAKQRLSITHHLIFQH